MKKKKKRNIVILFKGLWDFKWYKVKLVRYFNFLVRGIVMIIKLKIYIVFGYFELMFIICLNFSRNYYFILMYREIMFDFMVVWIRVLEIK